MHRQYHISDLNTDWLIDLKSCVENGSLNSTSTVAQNIFDNSFLQWNTNEALLKREKSALGWSSVSISNNLASFIMHHESEKSSYQWIIGKSRFVFHDFVRTHMPFTFYS